MLRTQAVQARHEPVDVWLSRGVDPVTPTVVNPPSFSFSIWAKVWFAKQRPIA